MAKVTVPADQPLAVRMAAALVEDLAMSYDVHQSLDILVYAIGIIHNSHLKAGVDRDVAITRLLANGKGMVESIKSTTVRG